jgi:hypothetical protein
MGQIEVYEFLKAQRLNGNEQFWTCKEVEFACRNNGFTSGMIEGIRGDLLRLECSGYLEAMIQKTGWNRSWRIKSKYAFKTTNLGKCVQGER